MRAYGIRTIDEKAIGELYGQFLVGYWPQERFLTEQAYKRIAFPSENSCPDFTMSLIWPQNQLEAYLRSWSAVHKYSKANGCDPAAAPSDQLILAWGNEPAKIVVWPLVFILCCKTRF
jgi:hypothetical protein